ncbi:hypothetical protein HS961_12490 [Comamonas piscis]|uniref:RiboL-PSP-HEPN domain-containing protein n=1 Tax=Comamonas piscis TaxID=1562974 RepID=A0A7G5EHV3_9BURK|nr:hypothetical protein [Comamonas piscis]QMV73578.1 hypothetical protein HS961_12490 [Comamonas piscis]WSO31999.1 hypothetical protein VUJ63_12525 [Comamonas piscis]
MLPIDQFKEAWGRCDHLSVIHAFLSRNVAPVLRPDEILRAEWAARVSALDMYIHELVAQRMLAIFEGRIVRCPGFSSFSVPTETMERIRTAATPTDASAAFDLTVRDQLSRRTFQYPEDIADGLRLCSGVALWGEVALKLGATVQSKDNEAKRMKKELTQIVARRNKIVHEGDMQPITPRAPWPINQADVAFVTGFINSLVNAIDVVV